MVGLKLRHLLLIAFCVSSPPAQAGEPVFACSLGRKTVSVVRDGDDWVYRFGTPGKVELTIVGNVTKNNVFFRAERYFTMEYQLRFTKSDYSYIVYSFPGNHTTGARDLSGLIVLHDMTAIERMSCNQYAHLYFDEARALPEDGENYLFPRL